jgi:hypothetical protein
MNVMAVTQEFLLKNPDTVERAMKAYIEAVAKMNNDKTATVKVLAKYTKRNDASFLDETYGIVIRFTEKMPRVDGRNVATVLEFEPVKGVDGQRRGCGNADPQNHRQQYRRENRQRGIYRKGFWKIAALTRALSGKQQIQNSRLID